MAEVGLISFLQILLLDNLLQIEVALQMPFFFCPFIHPFLIFPLLNLPVYLKHLVLVDLGHLVYIFKEVFLEITEFFLDDFASLVLIYSAHRRGKVLAADAVSGFRDDGGHIKMACTILSMIYLG